VILDYHMHLVDDDEPFTAQAACVDRIERYVDAARVAGVDEIGLTDHVSRFSEARDWFDHPLWVGDATADLDSYHALVTAAREGGLPIKAGLEVDFLDGREEQIRQVTDGWRWDFLLGSVHWVDGLAVDWDAAPIWERYPVDEVWRRYTEELCNAATSGLYDTMAHPDLAKVFGHRPDPRPTDLYERIADAFQAAGVCAEVSTGGYSRALGEIYPDPELLSMLARRNVPVTLGSDAHSADRIGWMFDRALDVLAGAGYQTITQFEGREPRQVAFG
jgi:histidinol-phosphatase (PHP family)